MRAQVLLVAAAAGCGIDVAGSLGVEGDASSEAASDPGATAGPDASDDGSVDATTSGESGDDGRDDAPEGNAPASIKWSATPNPPPIDLTQQGGIDWAHWGDHADGSPVRKMSGGGVLGNFTLTGPLVCNDNTGPDWPVLASWSDGAPEAIGTNTNLHRRFYGTNGLTVSLAAPCDGASHVLLVDFGGWSSAARFEADFDNLHVSPPIQDPRGNMAGYYAARYAVTYVCPSSSRLVVRWVATNLPQPTGCSGADLILSSAALR